MHFADRRGPAWTIRCKPAVPAFVGAPVENRDGWGRLSRSGAMSEGGLRRGRNSRPAAEMFFRGEIRSRQQQQP
jgi:hypothetical protein